MRIEFISRLESIKSLQPTDLPSFVVLTGLNGSGKSHLLNAIDGGQVQAIDGSSVIPPSDILRTSYRDMKLEPLRSHDVDGAWKTRRALVDTRQTVRASAVQQRDNVYKKYGLDPSGLNPEDSVSEPSAQALANLDEPKRRALEQELESLANNQAPSFAQALPGGNNAQNQALARSIQERLGKPLVDATDGELRWKVPSHFAEVTLLNNAFSQEFGNYVKLKEQNEYHQFRNATYSEDHDVLSEREFIEAQGAPPWELANEVFRAAAIPAQFDEPPSVIEGPYSATLRHTRSGDLLNFTSLSSGEQVLAVLALSVYKRRSKNQAADLPRVLLLDEIDAPLHPSMVQRLIDTIETVFVKQYGMHVILATHSPTTVALSPESSVYEMNTEDPRVRKVSQEAALRNLSTGLPTLSVRVEERRPIFVESDNDVRYYENLFGALQSEIGELAYSPQFLSTSSKPGSGDLTGRERVTTLTNKLAAAGVEQIRGLVDGDGKAQPTHPIIAVGACRRHGIENYLLDPILIGLFLTKMQFNSKVSPADLGLVDTSDTWGGLNDADTASLQAIADGVVSRVTTPHEAVNTVQKSTLAGGQTVSLPQWVCTMRGHDWEELLKSAFPELQRYKSEKALKSAVIAHVCRMKPHLVSNDLVETFEDLLS